MAFFMSWKNKGGGFVWRVYSWGLRKRRERTASDVFHLGLTLTRRSSSSLEPGKICLMSLKAAMRMFLMLCPPFPTIMPFWLSRSTMIKARIQTLESWALYSRSATSTMME